MKKPLPPMTQEESNETINPRVLAWLNAAGLKRSQIARRSGEDMPVVVVNGDRNEWTVHFTRWIGDRWTEWAQGLGFKSHIEALLGGATDDEFDAFLAEWKPATEF